MANQKNQDKNKAIATAVLLIALLLFSFKKKPQGEVEVGQGEFGDFGTDGELNDDTVANLKNGIVSTGKTSIPGTGKGGYNDQGIRPTNRTKSKCCDVA